MSFNYKEIEQAAILIDKKRAEHQGLTVRNVSLISYKLPAHLPDLNIGIFFEEINEALVFSLKAPWVGVFLIPNRYFVPDRRSWQKAFKGAPTWAEHLLGSKLKKVSAKIDDRVVTLQFSNEVSIIVELFSARPNWVLMPPESKQKISWRETKKVEKKHQPPVMEVRSFSKVALKEKEKLNPATWFADAFAHYKNLRIEAFKSFYFQKILSAVLTQIAQKNKIKRQLVASLDKASRADELRAQAEALKGMLYQHPKNFHASQIDGIKLDSKLTLTENAEKMFDRYKKLNRTKKEAQLRLDTIDAELKKVQSILAETRKFEATQLVEESKIESVFHHLDHLAQKLHLDLQPGVKGKAAAKSAHKSDKKWQKAGVKRFLSKEGLEIFIGRNHKENQELVVRLAKGNDIWLHIKGRPGAHGIVRIPRGKTASLETLLDAATLVAHYSSVKTGERVDVDYTFRKNVKRVKNTGRSAKASNSPFLVTYNQNKTLNVTVEDHRLAHLQR